MIEQRHVIQELDNREVDIFYSHQVSEWLNITAESTVGLLDGLVNKEFLHHHLKRQVIIFAKTSTV